MNKKSTREQIVEAADTLFYRRGYEHTSFANIAAAVSISRGNFYHHFKSKDQILSEVIEARLSKTRGMLQTWQQQGDGALSRLRCFVDMLRINREPIKAYGCPVGTLSTELCKLQHSAVGDSQKIFSLFRDWLALQFEQLGHADNARSLAMHLLGRVQGVAVMMSAYGDDLFADAELQTLHRWLDGLAENVPARF